MKVGRSNKPLTADEMRAIAKTLAELKHLSNVLLHQLNGRVKVEWLDPLLSFGNAHQWYEKLRSALDDDWGEIVDPHDPVTSPFYGKEWQAIADRGMETKDP